MKNPLIISFYTPDWEYPDHASRLKKECEELNLENHIIEIPSFKDYPKNCNIKPKFILDCFLKFKRSVLWIDVDNSIIKLPEEMINNDHYDIIGVSKQNIELIYVNCLYFNYTEVSKNFLKQWIEVSENFIDDGAFQLVSKKMSEVKILKLNTLYNQTQFKPDQIVTSEACFINRLSSSDLKWAYKNKVENNGTTGNN